MHVSTGVRMNFCKFLETLKSEINSLYRLKLRRNRFKQVSIAFENIVKPILSVTFHAILGRPPVSKMKLLEKCHWSCSVIFIVSPVFIAALNVSVMGESPVGLIVLLKQRKT